MSIAMIRKRTYFAAFSHFANNFNYSKLRYVHYIAQ
jgi:hypothetical protein